MSVHMRVIYAVLAIVLFLKLPDLAEVVERERLYIITKGKTDEVGSWVELLRSEGIQFPNVVLAQMVHETNYCRSRIYKENNNLFGMRHNSRGISKGERNQHAYYDTKLESIKDYAAWQKVVLRLRPVTNETQYLSLLENLPLCKNCRYAEDKQYIKKIHARMRELRELGIIGD